MPPASPSLRFCKLFFFRNFLSPSRELPHHCHQLRYEFLITSRANWSLLERLPAGMMLKLQVSHQHTTETCGAENCSLGSSLVLWHCPGQVFRRLMVLQKILALYTHKSTQEHLGTGRWLSGERQSHTSSLPNLTAVPKPGANAFSGTNKGPQSSVPGVSCSVVRFGVGHGIYQHLKTR